MWSGASINIPTGWLLCDGTNNTPDLRDRFIVGAGNSYSVGATGGEATHTLTVNEMPSHSHSIVMSAITSDGGSACIQGSSSNTQFTRNINSNGSGYAHENRPPYYALCFIMKQ